MLPLWGSSIARATRDIDMLGTATMSPAEIEGIVGECMQVTVDPDGLEFLPDSIELSEIRKEERYGGTRATFQARMERPKIHLQLDVGFGDVVTPGPVEIHYPTLLEHEAPALAGYTAVTAIAEKLSAIVDLGLANSRMKDYWDLWSISRALERHGPTLATAIWGDVRRREMPLPATQPPGLGVEFAELDRKVLAVPTRAPRATPAGPDHAKREYPARHGNRNNGEAPYDLRDEAGVRSVLEA